MKKTRTKSVYDFRGFSGMDTSLDICLFGYGIAWQLRKKREQEYLFVYGIGMNDNCEFDRFAYTWLNKKDWINMCNDDWFDLQGICEFYDTTPEEFITDFPRSVMTAVQYHGNENVFGSCYHEGFTIKGGY